MKNKTGPYVAVGVDWRGQTRFRKTTVPPGPPVACMVEGCTTMIPWQVDHGQWHRPFTCDDCTARFYAGLPALFAKPD